MLLRTWPCRRSRCSSTAAIAAAAGTTSTAAAASIGSSGGWCVCVPETVVAGLDAGRQHGQEAGPGLACDGPQGAVQEGSLCSALGRGQGCRYHTKCSCTAAKVVGNRTWQCQKGTGQEDGGLGAQHHGKDVQVACQHCGARLRCKAQRCAHMLLSTANETKVHAGGAAEHHASLRQGQTAQWPRAMLDMQDTQTRVSTHHTSCPPTLPPQQCLQPS